MPMNTNRKAFVQRALNQRAIIQRAINQRAIIQRAINQRAIIQRAINQRAINQQTSLVKTEKQVNLIRVKNVEKTLYVPVDIPENIPKIVLNKI